MSSIVVAPAGWRWVTVTLDGGMNTFRALAQVDEAGEMRHWNGFIAEPYFDRFEALRISAALTELRAQGQTTADLAFDDRGELVLSDPDYELPDGSAWREPCERSDFGWYLIGAHSWAWEEVYPD